MRYTCLTALFLSFPLAAVAQPLQLEGGVTVIHQTTGESRIADATTVSADLFLSRADSRGSWLIYLEANNSVQEDGVATRFIESNADAGSALDEDRHGRIQISEFNYTFNLDEDRLVVGLIDPSAYLDRTRITNDENLQFLGVNFVNNPTIEFPDYSLGTVWQRSARDGWPELNFVVSSSHGLADNPNLSYPQLVSISDSDKGVFAGAGAGFSGRNYLLRVGAWLNSAPHETLQSDRTDADNYGIYGVLGLSRGNHGLNFRLGAANPEVSRAGHFIAAAYRLQTGSGAFGLGISNSILSDEARAVDTGNTTLAEMFYRLELTDQIHLTPSIQYIRNSNFDSSGSIHDANSRIFSLRFHYGL